MPASDAAGVGAVRQEFPYLGMKRPDLGLERFGGVVQELQTMVLQLLLRRGPAHRLLLLHGLTAPEVCGHGNGGGERWFLVASGTRARSHDRKRKRMNSSH